MRRYKDRWLIGLSAVLSVLLHVGLVVFLLKSPLGSLSMPWTPRTVDFDLSELDEAGLPRPTDMGQPEDEPQRLDFERIEANRQRPQKADAWGFQDHTAERTTRRADVPIEESQRLVGPHGPAHGPGRAPNVGQQVPDGAGGRAERGGQQANAGNAGEGGDQRGLPPVPEVGEGVGAGPTGREPQPGQGGRGSRSVDEMLARAGMPAPGGGSGGSAINPYNPDVGPPGEVLSISTREYKYMAYFAHMKEKIEMAWIYPQESQMSGQQGTTTLQFVVERSGQVSSVKLLRTSGYPLLDKFAKKAVREAHFNPMPSGWPDQRLTVVANFIYRLIGVRTIR